MEEEKIFLGGTSQGWDWRNELIEKIETPTFNPVVEYWNEQARQTEITEKEKYCNIHLYVITPYAAGVFSIAEAVESAMRNDKIAVFCYTEGEFSKKYEKSLYETGKLIERHGGFHYPFKDINELANFLNSITN